jgi:hypothetical protein
MMGVVSGPNWWEDERALFQSGHDEAARSEMTKMRDLFGCSARENTDVDRHMGCGLAAAPCSLRPEVVPVSLLATWHKRVTQDWTKRPHTFRYLISYDLFSSATTLDTVQYSTSVVTVLKVLSLIWTAHLSWCAPLV